MALYDYKCDSCGHVFEVFHAMSAAPVVTCEKCKAKSCKKQFPTNVFGTTAGREVWEYNDVRQVRPKYVKSRDGKTRVRFDSSKHGYGKGTG